MSVDVAGTRVYSYTAGNQLFTEDGPFTSDTVTNTYLNRLRTALALQQPTGTWTNGFIYDAAGRLTNVTSQAGSFGYEYISGVAGQSGFTASLIKRLLLPNTSVITNDFDSTGHQLGTWLKTSSGTLLDSATYGYNQANQRTTFTNAAGTYYQFTYDKIGQLKVGDSSLNSEDRSYSYDAAWNLASRTSNTVSRSFTVDSKNQLTRISNPIVTYGYDTNGNTTSRNGGPGVYTCDDENRLIEWASYRTNSAHPADGDLISDFVYDGLGRMRERLEYHYSSQSQGLLPTGWLLDSETHYIYDGMRVIQERDGSNNPLVSYTRGPDLSRTMEGAGGIGGLLGRSSGYSSGDWTNHNFYHADGNGNITYLVNSSQSLAASYRYDPFGGLMSSSGTLAGANVYRFSSKEIHVNSGMYYYLYRFYDPNLQRWINRDPVGEPGFKMLPGHPANPIFNEPNLYSFVGNEPTISIDAFGLLRQVFRNCNPTEALACQATCIKTGVKSCTVHEIWGTDPDGKPWLILYDPDCQCNPPRKRIPWKGIGVGVCIAIIIIW